MMIMQLELPDEVAEAIRDRGMLSSAGVTELLRGALRSQALDSIADFARETEALGFEPFSEEEIEEEIRAVRQGRRA